jgi:hypothetical protein
MSALGHKRTLTACLTDGRFKADINHGEWHVPPSAKQILRLWWTAVCRADPVRSAFFGNLGEV